MAIRSNVEGLEDRSSSACEQSVIPGNPEPEPGSTGQPLRTMFLKMTPSAMESAMCNLGDFNVIAAAIRGENHLWICVSPDPAGKD